MDSEDLGAWGAIFFLAVLWAFFSGFVGGGGAGAERSIV